MSKETRKERNRITARESRERKAAYVVQIEVENQRLSDRVAQLEYDLSRAAPNPFIYQDESATLLSPRQMGFFDE